MTRRERIQRRRRNRGGPAQMLFLGLGIFSIVLVLSGIGLVTYVVAVANGGPSLSSLEPKSQGAVTTLYDSDGRRLGFIKSNILRSPISDEEIPQVMRDATVAIEDRRFFDHKGVDFEGVVRAALRNLDSGSTVEGGSTLTMQLIRNLYTGDRERSFKRKLREARLAEELEDEHPGREGKLWILNKYINNVPYGTSGGQSALGVQAAARIFFDKPAKELTLPEAALLAGLPQAPTTFNPILNPNGAKARRDQVLRAMLNEHMIDNGEYNAAVAAPLGAQVGKFYRQRAEGYFFDYVQQQLIDEYGPQTVRRGGLKVYTTLDRDKQRVAREVVQGAVAGTDKAAAIVTVDPRNGHIPVMATSGSYGQFKFNLAAQGGYAAGSTFKIMVLMAALRKGVDPKTTFYTSKPLKFDDPRYGPIDVKTYSGSYSGRIDLVTATLQSDNSVYQQLDLDIGPDEVARTAKDMGITSKLNGYPAEGLGGLEKGVSPLEMANAYATIASGGLRSKLTAVTKVCIPKDDDDQSFDCRETKPERTRVFTDGVADQAIQILKANITGGTGGAANIGCPAGGKTGTVDLFTDAWFVGITPRMSSAAWVGHADGRRTLGEGMAGGTTAAPLWGAFMRVAKGKYCGDWPGVKDPFVPEPFAGKYSMSAPAGPEIATTTTPTTTESNGTGGVNGEGDDPEPPTVSTPAPETTPPTDNGGAVATP